LRRRYSREQPAQDLPEPCDVAGAIGWIIHAPAIGKTAQDGASARRDEDMVRPDRTVFDTQLMKVGDGRRKCRDEACDIVD
jgi:hypothetical protein